MSEQRDGKTPETALDGIVEVQMTTTEYEHIQNLLEREKHTFCAFCGGKFPGSGTTDDLKEHMLSCEHHPMAAQRQRIAQLEERVKELEDICAYVADCKPHGKRYLSEAGAIGKDYGKDQAQERDYLREQVKQLEAEVARLNGVVTSLKQSEMYWVGEAEKYSAEVARLSKAMDPIDQECCDLQVKWKTEAQWAAKQIVDHGVLHPDSQQDIWHAQRILDGKL